MRYRAANTSSSDDVTLGSASINQSVTHALNTLFPNAANTRLEFGKLRCVNVVSQVLLFDMLGSLGGGYWDERNISKSLKSDIGGGKGFCKTEMVWTKSESAAALH